jgi:hypothetical protein
MCGQNALSLMLKQVAIQPWVCLKRLWKRRQLHTVMTASKFSDVKCTTSPFTVDQSSSFGFSGGLLGFFMKPIRPFLLFSPSYINFWCPFLLNKRKMLQTWYRKNNIDGFWLHIQIICSYTRKLILKNQATFLPSSMFGYNRHISIIGLVWHRRFYPWSTSCTK